MLVGVPRSTIREHVVRSGIVRGSVPRPGRRKKSGARAGFGNGRATTAPLTMQAARAVAVSTLRGCLERQRGVMAKDRKRREGSLTASDREEIRVGIELGESDDEIARRIGRHRSTVWREIKANGGRFAYNAAGADERVARVAALAKALGTTVDDLIHGPEPGLVASTAQPSGQSRATRREALAQSKPSTGGRTNRSRSKNVLLQATPTPPADALSLRSARSQANSTSPIPSGSIRSSRQRRPAPPAGEGPTPPGTSG